MAVIERPLKVLGEFKPFGLVAESMDGGEPPEEGEEGYDYFLFDPQVAYCREDVSETADFGGCGEDELFIRGNRMIWSKGSCVHRRYTSNSTVVMACWCRMDAISEPFLCALQIDSLTIYSTAGEIVQIPLFYCMESIWPLPFGLLFQRVMDGTSLRQHDSISNSWLNTNSIQHSGKDGVPWLHHNFNSHASSNNIIGDSNTISSLFLLKHPLEEIQSINMKDKEELISMRDFEDKIIWTCDIIPLIASYSKAKMQHSIWLIQAEVSGCEAAERDFEGSLSQFSFCSIWHGKCSQTAATKVFLATDDDGAPIVSFLLPEQKGLLSARLHIGDNNHDVSIDVKFHLSWIIPALDAAPVIVTRPRVKVGLLPFRDQLVLDLDNCLRLYSGKRCLCKYYLCSYDQASVLRGMPGSFTHDVIGLADAVGGQLNLLLRNGQMLRCTLRQDPSSALVNDCITALTEGMHPSSYNHFSALLWSDSESAYLSNPDSHVEAEWESFSGVFMKFYKKSGVLREEKSVIPSQTSWEYLINSKFHINYCQKMSLTNVYPRNFGINAAVDHYDREESFYAQILTEALDSLHALYESLKLDILRKRDLSILVHLVCDLAACLGEDNYVDLYLRDFPLLFHKVGSIGSNLHPKNPPSILRWIETCLKRGPQFADHEDLPQLIYKDGKSFINFARKVVSFYSILFGSGRSGRKLSTGTFVNIAAGSASDAEELTVLAMAGEGFGLQHLDLLPPGVSLALRHALERCRESPPCDWPAAAYVLVGREDLALRSLWHSREIWGNGCVSSSDLSVVSAPYMLHLNPVTVNVLTSDGSGVQSDASMDDGESFDVSMTDGMEHMFNSSTQLRYGRDLRLFEVRRLLCSSKIVVMQTSVNASASDQDLQQAQLWQLAKRTTALPFGRGAFTLATTCTLLTEALSIPKLNLAGRLAAQQNATINLDTNIRNIPELKKWPEFHNGVAVGLKLSPCQVKITRTWISYNRPEHPNPTHAGLLFALGLHGHLRALSNSDVFQYLTQDDDITILGMLLGVATSYRGTMDPWVTKMLYLHIPSRHPSFFPELELPSLLQSAALLAVGILYEGSAHPQTMKTLLGEISRRSSGDSVLEREGYSVSAGAALGLVGLGLGKDALGLKDSIVDRLFQYMGCKELYSESSNRLGRMDGCIRRKKMVDGTMINVDVTAPGATLALTLMFMKTESEEVAARISVPQTFFSLQYVRPDFIMLRVIARNLILWNRIVPDREWLDSQIPEIVNKFFPVISDDCNDYDGMMVVETICQAYINIVTGACMSVGLKYAGSRNKDAQELLYDYALYLLNEIKQVSPTNNTNFPRGLSRYIDRCSLETCLHLVVLSLSTVMAGSGHLPTFRLLRYLRGRSSSDGHSNYGNQMAVSLAIGFLFLGGGTFSFSTGNSAVAALLIALYPRLPTGLDDNRCHLQAFRHLYVLAAERRWVQTIDVDTGLPVYAPLEVTIKETENHRETSFCDIAPCILPQYNILKAVTVCGPRYWPQVIEFMPNTYNEPLWKPGGKVDPLNGGILYVKRKVGACSYIDDPIGCQSLLSQAMHKVVYMSSSKPDARYGCNRLLPSSDIDHLISTFSANPSLISFAQVCSDLGWENSFNVDFKEFCLQVLFECVCKDRPALLQIYVSFYMSISSMADQMLGSNAFDDALFLYSLKIAVAYNEAVISGKLSSSKGVLIQSSFLVAMNRRIEDILSCCQSGEMLSRYLRQGKWPHEERKEERELMLLSWYLQWFGLPPASQVNYAIQKVKLKVPLLSGLPLLHLWLPTVHINALTALAQFDLDDS